PYTVRTYYLSNCDECSPSDGIPTLKMAELVGSSIQVTPLVEGIEDIHFEYGFDLDANGAPDCFAADPADDTAPADCPAGWSTTDSVNWSNITSVRVHLLARSIDATGSWTDNRTYDLGRAARSGPFDDHYKRQVYSTVLAIPNVGGVRE
ncbi:MAG: PilW family protein, partial [Pseudomonas sp.]